MCPLPAAAVACVRAALKSAASRVFQSLLPSVNPAFVTLHPHLPSPLVPHPPAQQPWQPAPGQQPWVPQATIENAEGMVTATLGAKSCTLTEALAEGQTVPPMAPVTMQWGTEWIVVRAYPSGETLACKLEEAPADRR
ncbi:hypothetical protein I4F81_004822 [Pyropia yezoensis]|uniref:Uncharacterized protein n=1 Tax=Pyropia yezoensis TaxID=2788 RepID=A0ACC3BXE0_PYRYE|nr:hypothetical protein I4F81_004822 [Neopyropia yezoensis]